MIHYSAGDLTDAIQEQLRSWQSEKKVQRLWSGDTSLWTEHDENKWMGWLDVGTVDNELTRILSLAEDIKAAGFIDIVVLGMGGSSLCPAMLAETFNQVGNLQRLYILDSTDPAQILHLETKINLPKTLFIVSSKSGSTLEPNIFKEYFTRRLQKVLNTLEVGDHFIAITDPGSKLEKVAKAENFKTVFYGVPSIGGRYSALSNFGMVPAGLMGLDIKAFLHHAKIMQQRCLPNKLNNPSLLLGIILGVAANAGKNKLTLIVSPPIHALGAWIEQLIAESTGKEGKALIPINQEPLGDVSVYSNDRIFVYIRLETAIDEQQEKTIQSLQQAGFMSVIINVQDKMHLGGELYRWEFATAVAGSIMGINPFNQPDVELSKILALRILNDYDQHHQLATMRSLIVEDGLTLFIDEENQSFITSQSNIIEYLKAHLDQLEPGDYVDLCAFIEMSQEHEDLLQQSRILIRDQRKVATSLGFGPRFLHSTGQAYKGGPNTGVFLQITADHHQDINVPNHKYSFGLVINAQAQADFNALAQVGRRILRLHLGNDVAGGLKKLINYLSMSN